jgi:hypothetical protein
MYYETVMQKARVGDALEKAEKEFGKDRKVIEREWRRWAAPLPMAPRAGSTIDEAQRHGYEVLGPLVLKHCSRDEIKAAFVKASHGGGLAPVSRLLRVALKRRAARTVE